MSRTRSISGAFAFVACFVSLFAVGAGSVHAVGPLPDARILSAAPFEFHADRGIFSRMSVEPTDSRIFKAPEPIRSAGEPRMDEHAKRSSMI